MALYLKIVFKFAWEQDSTGFDDFTNEYETLDIVIIGYSFPYYTYKVHASKRH